MENERQRPYQAYFENNAIPWLTAHLSMRSTGLELFTAAQAALVLAWATKTHWAIPALGLVSCLTFYLWDRRIRFMLRMVVLLGEQLVEKDLFGTGTDQPTTRGLYRMIAEGFGAYTPTRGFFPRLRVAFQEGSHSWAVSLMTVSASILWLWLLLVGVLDD